MFTLTGAEMEPIQNFKTGLVRSVRTVDRPGRSKKLFRPVKTDRFVRSFTTG